jgi:hypothetical protein
MKLKLIKLPHKLLTEELKRIKSLFTEERLYGNLVDKENILTEQGGRTFGKLGRYMDDVSANMPKLKNADVRYKGTIEAMQNYRINDTNDLFKHLEEFGDVWRIIVPDKDLTSAKKILQIINTQYAGDLTKVDLFKKNANGIMPIQYITREGGIRQMVLNLVNSEGGKWTPNPIKPINKQKNVQSYLLNKSNGELLSILNSKGIMQPKGWFGFGPPVNFPNHSGWKFHIFGENLADSAFLIDKLEPIAKKYGANSKVGGPNQMVEPTMQVGGNQYGKQGVTMYIPQSVIDAGKHKEMLVSIQNAIKGYGEHPFTKGGTIIGDKEITPQIHYRYELTGPIPPGGLNDKLYDILYNTNKGGTYKPDDVEEIFK